MADLSITAVRPTTTTRVQNVAYGATIAAGDSLYLDTADDEYKLADADNSALTAGSADVAIALTPGVDGGRGLVVKRGGGAVILVGPTMTVGQEYVVSTTAGGIAPRSDLSTTNDYITYIGTASSATQLEIDLNATGIQVP